MDAFFFLILPHRFYLAFCFCFFKTTVTLVMLFARNCFHLITKVTGTRWMISRDAGAGGVARKALDVEGNFVFIATRRREETTHANNPPVNQTLNVRSHATEIKLQTDTYKNIVKKNSKRL